MDLATGMIILSLFLFVMFAVMFVIAYLSIDRCQGAEHLASERMKIIKHLESDSEGLAYRLKHSERVRSQQSAELRELNELIKRQDFELDMNHNKRMKDK